MIERTFSVEPRPGDTIRGRVLLPEGPPPRSAVVIVHGFKGFKDWGFFPYVTERVAGAGHAAVIFDLSRNGVGADAAPGNEFTELERFAANTLSTELDDVRAVLNEVFEGELVPRAPDSVGLLGHSRGGGQVILAAGEEPRVDAVVSWNAVGFFDRWTDETKAEWRENGRVYVMNSRTGQQMPLDVTLLEDYEANRDRLDIPGTAARLETPWLIVHGTHDITVRAKEGRRLAEIAKGASLELVNEAGHTFNAKHPFDGTTPALESALDATLAHFARHLG